MTRRSLFLCAAVGLAMTLAAGPAAAAPDWPGLHPSAGIRAFFAPVWSFLSSLVSNGDSTLPGETLDTRCGIDPDGHTFCGETLDNRSGIDPDGHTFCGDALPSNG